MKWNEAKTRLELIDPALRKAGWGVVEDSYIEPEFAITDGRLIGQGKRKNTLSADYLLVYKNRRLAVVEAKARDKHYTDGVAQAKDYATKLKIRHTYSTNGDRIYGMDMERGTEAEVASFPTPDELLEMTFPMPSADDEDACEVYQWKKRFSDVPDGRYLGKFTARYHQYNAMQATLNAIAEGRNRLLLTMATGTGKTATAFHICWKLFHAKWNLKRDASRKPRILFLADRNILANQAFNGFGEFEKVDENMLVRIKAKQMRQDNAKLPTNGNIFFTIFQTFMTGSTNLSDEELEQETELAQESLEQGNEAEQNTQRGFYGQYPSDFFDLIIIDECHRGGANNESSWRDIMEHFSDAVQLGLTATPRRDDNADTYDYFEEPIYTYSLKEGINDGFLSPFRFCQVSTVYDEYTLTKDDVVLQGEAEVGTKFDYTDYGRNVIIHQIELKRVKKFLDIINQKEKTLVFCATQKHAAIIRDMINQETKIESADYCHRVTAEDGKLGEQHLKDFQDDEKQFPTILTTSQKLSTGVDAPEIRNIVLLRPVNSMIEFKQIVGRGTRVADGKDYFTIYDFVKAYQHFEDTKWDGEPENNGNDSKTTTTTTRETKTNENDGEVTDNPPKQLIEVKLADGVARNFDSMVKTIFLNAHGEPVSSESFIRELYGELPKLFSNEEELRKIWSVSSTRQKLLDELSEHGFNETNLHSLKSIINADDSDLFDVLSYIAYNKDTMPRLERAKRAKTRLHDYSVKQYEFIEFILEQYTKEGEQELNDAKLPELIKLQFGTLTDAKNELGSLPNINDLFSDIQKQIYNT